MHDSNLEQLIAGARLLRPLLEELVFVGGCMTGLLITDDAAPDPRATFDVDAIAEITSYAEYATFSDRLRALGFAEDTREDAPLCRWTQGPTTLDVMPLNEKILGFSNRWYRAAMEASVWTQLRKDLEIRTITAPYFVATKLEAFKGRGKGDLFGSHDLEDLISVVDGRAALVDEVQELPTDVKTYIGMEVARLLRIRKFLDALPGYLLPDAVSQERMSIVLGRLEKLARR